MGLAKEKYFAMGTKIEIPDGWKKSLSAIRTIPNSIKLPSSTALLVLDMQVVFLSPISHAFIPSAPAIIPNINQLIALFEKLNYPVIFTRHLTSDVEGDSMKRWWRHPIETNDPLSSIYPDLRVKSSTIIEKHHYSAFFKTDLDAQLQSQGITTILITGVMTHLCCETTAREGFMRGYNIIFPLETSATYTREFHLGTLRNITHGFGWCPPLKMIIQSLEGK